MRAIWISWSVHRRTTGLCDAWDIPLHVLRAVGPAPVRWIVLSWRTLGILWKTRPDVLFVQNPSLALTILATIIRPVFRYRLVVDAHNEGVRPFDRPYAVVRWVTRLLLKSADFTIVTNDALAVDVVDAGGRALTLPDRLPSVPTNEGRGIDREDSVDVVVVATYRRDEPISAIVEAAATMPDLRFAITGPAVQYSASEAELPSNVRLTGFLLDPDYWRLLARASIVCDLSLKSDCLVCGAYEALAVGKPMVLSDNPPTRRIFGSVAVLTSAEAGDIASAIRKAVLSRDSLAANAESLKKDYPKSWEPQASDVLNAIEADTDSGERSVT
jgi:glycosyltransferase involved in cell wall biosynthesis